MTEMTEWQRGNVALFVVGLSGFLAICFGYWLAPSAVECPAPDYDVARVVKMHEEGRQCETTLEECKDTVKICAGLLKQALE